MTDYLKELFLDLDIRQRVKNKMPALFQLAELDSSRAGKIGMEIGSVREKIIIALLMYKFGEENVKTNIPITKSEIDVILFDKAISIKTISGVLSGVKLIWTVDTKKAIEFSNNYYPSVDLLLVQINWRIVGWFYYFPISSQIRIFNKIGRKNYIKLPKQGTNPRGVEMSRLAVELLTKDKQTLKIDVKWERKEMSRNAYDPWVKLWAD